MAGRGFRSGIFLAPFHPNDVDTTLALQRDLELVEWCERLGYEEAWFGEYHSGGFQIIASPELMIAAAAERTRRMRLGTEVISCPITILINVADRIIQLDHMTRGSVMFGVGSGALVYDAQMRGIDQSKTRNCMAESLGVILRLLRGESVTRQTEWFTLKEAHLHILPYSRPYPETLVACSHTPNGGRLAGKFGVGMLCVAASDPGEFDTLGSNWTLANESAAENGHQMDLDTLRPVAPIHLSETREQVRANVRFGLEKYLDYTCSLMPSRREQAGGMDPVDVVMTLRGGIIGAPDDAIALINRFYDRVGPFGCFLQNAHNWADWEHTEQPYELYATYVVPRIRRSNDERIASLQMFKDHTAEIGKARRDAETLSFIKHNAERQAQGKEPIKVGH